VFAGRQAWGESFGSLIERRSMAGAVASGRIAYMSYVDEKLKAALMTGALALLYPSIFEGFGLPLLEAMAVGTPVLTSASTSMPEVVGECGYYFDPCDVDSLHAAFGRLRTDRATGALGDVVARARERASLFSYDATYRVIVNGLFPEHLVEECDRVEYR
jgi:glycosyltransferase involved in cell wall biosynthesis